MAEAAQAAAVDPGVAELTSDFFGDAQPSTETEQSQDTQKEPVQGQEQQPTETDASAQAPTQTPAQKFILDGKEYSQQELAAAIQTARQFPHLQGVHTETKRQLEAIQAAIAQRQQQPQAQQPQQAQRVGGVSVDQLKAMYAPAIKQAVSAGMIEADAAEAFPALTANLLYAYDQLADAREAMGHLINRFNSMERGSTEHAVVSEIRTSIASLAGAGEHFATLASPEEQARFFEYLVQINPQVGQLRDQNFLAKQWFAYNSDPIAQQLAALKQQQQQAQQASSRAQTRSLARGDGAGTRPGAAMPQDPDPLADMISDLYPQLVPKR